MAQRRVLTDYSRANRALRRGVAKAKVAKKGIRRAYSHGKGEKSWFSRNWKEL